MGGPVSYVRVYKNPDAAKKDKYSDVLEKINTQKTGISVLFNEPTVQNAMLFAPQRKNLFSWYPFKEKSSILVIGDECGAATGLLAANAKNITVLTEYAASADVYAYRFLDSRNLKIYAGELSEIIIGLESAFDYIILMPEYATPQMLKQISVLRKENTRIIIVANNRLGFKYLNGAKENETSRYLDGPFGYMDAQGVNYSKDEWQQILADNNAENAKFYYLYPDYLYTNEVFTDNLLPAPEKLSLFEPLFDGDVINLFDGNLLINKIVEKGEFAKHSNSFLIEIGPENNNISYAKVSCERAEKHQACTIICDTENGRIVKKVPAIGAAQAHIKNIEKFSEKLKQQCFGMPVDICECAFENGEINFPFVEGPTLRELIDKAVAECDEDKLLSLVEMLRKTVFYFSAGRTFTKSFKFITYFGNLDMPADLNSAAVSNIDLIADNIIVGPKNTIIDYEWVLDFPVPLEFIVFRSLYHNKAISSLSGELKNRVYEAAGLKSEYFPIFTLMENIFQNKIAGNIVKYSHIAKNVAPLVCNINDIDINKSAFQAKIYNAENPTEVYKTCNAVTQDITLSADLTGAAPERICIQTTAPGAIVKIKEVSAVKAGERQIISEFETNADVILNDDYYFANEPIVTVKNLEYSEISIKYFVYKYNDGFVATIINLINENQKLREQLQTKEETGE